ncbi:MAG TPA: peptidoglycan bridge formation glycyltransferase FemA/FemB family protein [Paludibacteraceae bacterium]|nr:peptidoglycan bridge formation glycyltransferase FemA/FemB family protein [Paludibacteraceae bacterium]HPT43470.1 peptidoglycan bridge formation glycyltransferase FemA/FemB family protein [Paludibacteraceae bacterium]
MLTYIQNKEIEQLYTTPIVQQTAFWSVVKKKLGATTLAINFNSRKSDLYNIPQSEDDVIVSDVLVIVRYIDQNHSIAYVPYGPELQPDDEFQGLFLEELSECIRSFLPKNCIMIRYDLCWESYWAKEQNYFDPDGNWIGEPQISTQEMRFNFNTVNWNFKKTSSNILPSNTIYVDLNKDIDEILATMKPKTRYNIGLAERRGIVVKSSGIENIDIWYKLYQETAQRNHILTNDIKYFRAVLSAKTNDMRSPAEVKLLIAEYNNQPLAAMFLIITGNRGTYLYGASSSENRNLMATYALQWEAIKISKASGCTEYDMFGVSPNPDPNHPLYGLYRFKTGFGGEIYHSLGCWDYPLDVEKHRHLIALELLEQGYHLN